MSLLYTYCSATSIIVEVHECPCISDSPFFGIYEGFGKLSPIVDIVTASTPVKLSSLVSSPSTLVWIAVTGLQLPLTAGTCECVHHPS